MKEIDSCITDINEYHNGDWQHIRNYDDGDRTKSSEHDDSNCIDNQ